jgi:hypothetical protein
MDKHNNNIKNLRKPMMESKKITRADFHILVKKAAQPVKQPSVSGEASTETSESQTCDGCTEKNTH